MRNLDMIIIHCAATKPNMDIGVKEIRYWHRKKGYLDIGYHYVIRRSGAVETGRNLNKAGAHASGYNTNSVGICMVGGLDEQGRPANNYTDAQWDSLKDLCEKLIDKYGVLKIIGHNEVANKSCPCFSVPKWLKNDMNKIQ